MKSLKVLAALATATFLVACNQNAPAPAEAPAPAAPAEPAPAAPADQNAAPAAPARTRRRLLPRPHLRHNSFP